MQRTLHGLIALTVAVTLGSCGDDAATQPSERGRMQVVIRDHPARSVALRVSQLASSASVAFLGTLSTNANASISVDGQTWVDLGSPNGITVQLQSTSDSTNVHGEVDAPLGTYTQVRLTLRNTQALVKAGSSVGPLALTADVLLSVGGSDGQVIIQKQVPAFTIRSGVRTTLSFELNSES